MRLWLASSASIYGPSTKPADRIPEEAGLFIFYVRPRILNPSLDLTGSAAGRHYPACPGGPEAEGSIPISFCSASVASCRNVLVSLLVLMKNLEVLPAGGAGLERKQR